MEHRDCSPVVPDDAAPRRRRRALLSVHWSGWLAVPLFAVAGFSASSAFAVVQGLTRAHAALHAGVNLGAGLAIALVAGSVTARLCGPRRPARTVKSASTFAFVAALSLVSTLVAVTALVAVTRPGAALASHARQIQTGYPFSGADTSYVIPDPH